MHSTTAVVGVVMSLAGLSHAQNHESTESAPTPAQIAARYGLTLAEYEFHGRMILAHGILMGLAFAVMYPLGAMFIRALSFKGLFWFHAGWQIFAYLITLVGLGLGVWLAVMQDQWVKTGHAIIGLIVIGLILLLPPLGWIHHVVFVKTRSRSSYTYLHRWLGRFVLVLGGINGGLGFWLAHDAPFWGIIAYSACAGAFYTLWLGAVTFLNPNRQLAKARKEAALGPVEVLKGSPTSSEPMTPMESPNHSAFWEKAPVTKMPGGRI